MIEGVIFDKDGTLFDFQATWGLWCGDLLRTLSDGNAARFAAMAEAVGFDPEHSRLTPGSIVVADTPEAIAHELLPHLDGWSGHALVSLMNARAAVAPQVEIAPLEPMMARLRARGLRLGLVTNDAETPARAHLRAAGCLAAFDFVAGSDSGHGAKPDPGPLLAFCQATGLSPGHVAMVGDSAHDLMAGRRAGMVCIAVESGMTARADLESFADSFILDIKYLEAALDAIP